jgi:glycosyltransferase involved in cell wall biosynthesis
MLSVIIATLDSEQDLVRTLAALVPGAMAGLVSEVLVADGGSSDDTGVIADAAGCSFMVAKGPLGVRLKAAAVKARAPWLLFLRPGTVLDTPWIDETRRFLQQPLAAERAAVFRRTAPVEPGLRQFWLLLTAAIAGPRPEQGLLIAKQLYEHVSGHSQHAVDPEAGLLGRIGKLRLVTLSTRAFSAG